MPSSVPSTAPGRCGQGGEAFSFFLTLIRIQGCPLAAPNTKGLLQKDGEVNLPWNYAGKGVGEGRGGLFHRSPFFPRSQWSFTNSKDILEGRGSCRAGGSCLICYKSMLLQWVWKDGLSRRFTGNFSNLAKRLLHVFSLSGDLVQELWHGGLRVQCSRRPAGERSVCQKYSPRWAGRSWWLKALWQALTGKPAGGISLIF